MTTYRSTQMCAECPFRANALPGWLGPWTVDDIHNLVHRNESHMICHTRLEQDQHCVGALRYMNSVCRQSHDEERLAAQRALREIPDQPLIPPFKFKEHHSLDNAVEFYKGQQNDDD